MLLLDSPMVYILNPLSANITKWSDILKQFVGKLLTNCLSVFDNFVWLALKGLSRYLFICFCWNTVQDFTIVLIGNNLEIVTSSSKRAFDMLIMNLGLSRFKSFLWHVGGLLWWESLATVLTGKMTLDTFVGHWSRSKNSLPQILTLRSLIFNPFRPAHFWKLYWNKNKLNFYFDTSLWCLKWFYEGLYGVHKTFWGTTKKSENKNLT